MTILRDPASMRYRSLQQTVIPGMSRGYAPTRGYQDYDRAYYEYAHTPRPTGMGGIVDTAQDFYSAARGQVTLGVGATEIRNLALFGAGVGLVVGVGIGFMLGRFVGRRGR